MVAISFLGLFMLGNAADVNINDAWHPLQQIAKSESDTTSVDSDGDGVMDNAENLTPSTGVSSLVYHAGNAILEIDSAASSFASIDLLADGSNEWGVGIDDNNNFYVSEHGVDERLYIEKGGNVGVGVDDPVSRLQVGPQIHPDEPLVTINSEDTSKSALRIKGDSGMSASPLVVFRGDDERAFKVHEDGNVGIGDLGGTHDPVSQLQVGPQIHSDEPLVTINAEDKAKGALRIRGSQSKPSAAPLVVFRGDSSEGDPAFKVDGNGNVGIGTTNPTEKLDVDGKIIMRDETASSDSSDTVATKSYVDDNSFSEPPECTGETDALQWDGSNWQCVNIDVSDSDYLVNGQHTVSNCEGLGKEVVTVEGDKRVCRFEGYENTSIWGETYYINASCPDGWSQYKDWSTTESDSCSDCTSCTTGEHNWANQEQETCTYKDYKLGGGCSSINPPTCYADITQIGCY
ncbi:MAG: hypothetical protein ACOCQG_04785, partial [Candidatus Nanoarchaeia archaeon]